jgi:hypothetical protein
LHNTIDHFSGNPMSLKDQITEDMKTAMRAKDTSAWARSACCWLPASSAKWMSAWCSTTRCRGGHRGQADQAAQRLDGPPSSRPNAMDLADKERRK